MKLILLTAAVILASVGGVAGVTILPPSYTEAFNAVGIGNSSANHLGFFRQNGGPREFRISIGTDFGTDFGPGSLIMDFNAPFTDGPGFDFAILTSSQSWGPLADVARFEFFLGGNLQASFTASLAPDQLFEFDLPGSTVVADRVVVSNITPDPPGQNDLATMTFDNAGVAYGGGGVSSSVPESSNSFFLLSIGVCSLLVMRRFLKLHTIDRPAAAF